LHCRGALWHLLPIGMRWLPSARACGQQNFAPTTKFSSSVLNRMWRLTQADHQYNGRKTVVVVVVLVLRLVLSLSPRNDESALLTFDVVRPRAPEPRDFRFRESTGVARQPHRVAFANRDVSTGQVVDDLRRNCTVTASIRWRNMSNKKDSYLKEYRYIRSLKACFPHFHCLALSECFSELFFYNKILCNGQYFSEICFYKSQLFLTL